MDRDIEYLESCLTCKLSDATMSVYSRSLAYFMLFCKRMSLEESLILINSIDDCTFRKLTLRLVASESDILSIEPKTLGTNLVSTRTAGNMQESLNVKQFTLENRSSDDRDQYEVNKFTPKTPVIKSNILHSDKEYIWLRWSVFIFF